MINANGTEEPLLRVSMDTFRDFLYQAAIVEVPVPMFGDRMSRETDVYYRIEVFTRPARAVMTLWASRSSR